MRPFVGAAVVAGAVVYDQFQMMTLPRWFSGRKRVGAPDSPETIEQSWQYLRCSCGGGDDPRPRGGYLGLRHIWRSRWTAVR
jgi:hypothetical protein